MPAGHTTCIAKHAQGRAGESGGHAAAWTSGSGARGLAPSHHHHHDLLLAGFLILSLSLSFPVCYSTPLSFCLFYWSVPLYFSILSCLFNLSCVLNLSILAVYLSIHLFLLLVIYPKSISFPGLCVFQSLPFPPFRHIWQFLFHHRLGASRFLHYPSLLTPFFLSSSIIHHLSSPLSVMIFSLRAWLPLPCSSVLPIYLFRYLSIFHLVFSLVSFSLILSSSLSVVSSICLVTYFVFIFQVVHYFWLRIMQRSYESIALWYEFYISIHTSFTIFVFRPKFKFYYTY